LGAGVTHGKGAIAGRVQSHAPDLSGGCKDAMSNAEAGKT